MCPLVLEFLRTPWAFQIALLQLAGLFSILGGACQSERPLRSERGLQKTTAVPIAARYRRALSTLPGSAHFNLPCHCNRHTSGRACSQLLSRGGPRSFSVDVRIDGVPLSTCGSVRFAPASSAAVPTTMPSPPMLPPERSGFADCARQRLAWRSAPKTCVRSAICLATMLEAHCESASSSVTLSLSLSWITAWSSR